VLRITRANVVGRCGGMLVWVALGCLVCGCGPKEEPLSDAKQHYLAANEAIQAGDTDKALEELTKSIEIEPDVWSYYHRAKLYEEKGETKKALADCEAGLAIDSDHAQLKWLEKEIKKPKRERFRGNQRDAPSDK